MDNKLIIEELARIADDLHANVYALNKIREEMGRRRNDGED